MKTLLTILTALTLTACGGGGGSAEPINDTTIYRGDATTCFAGDVWYWCPPGDHFNATPKPGTRIAEAYEQENADHIVNGHAVEVGGRVIAIGSRIDIGVVADVTLLMEVTPGYFRPWK